MVNRGMFRGFFIMDSSSEYRIKERIISKALKILAILGIVAYLPSMYLSVAEELWLVAVADTFAIVYIVIIAFRKKVPYTVKAFSLIITAYVLGVVLLLYTGPFGAGIIYLFGFLAVTALFFKFRMMLAANILASLTILVFILLNCSSVVHWNYPLYSLIVILVNFMLVGALVSAGIFNLMKGLRQHIENQQRLQEQLKVEIEAKDLEKKRAEDALNAKSFLLREMHHRIKNNLQVITSLINLHIKRKSADGLLGVKERVQAISLVHHLLYNDDNTDSVELISLFDTILENIEASMDTEGIRFVKDIKSTGVEISMDRATLISLIINEILMNSVKHAFPDRKDGEIKISVERRGEQLFLTISDNGIGFPDGTGPKQDKLGMVIIDVLVSQLKAKYSVDSSSGVCYILWIPLL